MARRERKQPDLPAEGMSRETIPEIDEAALEYVAQRDARIAAGQREKKALEALDEKLKRHNRDDYVFETDDGEKLRVRKAAAKMKITVRKVKEEDSSNGEVPVEGDED